MNFMFDGKFTPDKISRDLDSLWQLLQEKGITSIADVVISLTGRSNDHARFQVRNTEGLISTMVFESNTAGGADAPSYVPHGITSIDRRPEGLEVNAFASMFGHDD